MARSMIFCSLRAAFISFGILYGSVRLSTGDYHSMILIQDGSVWTCGLNSNGQLGIPSVKYASNSFKQAISGGATVAAAGTSHSIVLKQDGSVWVTGIQLEADDVREFRALQFIEGGRAAAAGTHHSMVLTQTGSVWSSGWNNFGQLGDRTNEDQKTFQMVVATGAKAIAAGHVHSIVLKLDGSVWAVGWNKNGQLGDQTIVNRNEFVQVMFDSAEAVAAGGYHSMVLKKDGTVWTTGWNKHGQLGISTDQDRNVYGLVAKNIKAISAGIMHSLILNQDGSVWTAGYNAKVQTGDQTGTETVSNFVMVISGGVKAIAAGGYHSMVLDESGNVYAAGSNRFGQLCLGTDVDAVQTFTKVTLTKTVGSDGKTPLPAVSNQDFDKLMETRFFSKNSQIGVTATTVAERMSLGEGHTLIVKPDTSVWAAGANNFGQLGVGTRASRIPYFVQLVSKGGKAVAAGSEHSLVRGKDGTVWAAGRNQCGQLGDGSNTDRFSFVSVISSDATAIAAGSKHSLVVLKGGSVWATGYNMYGQLGDGTTADKKKFTRVLLNGAQTVAAGAEHSLVLREDGSVWVAGGNEFGQLGDGSTTSRNTFAEVLSAGAKAIAGGGYHSMLLKKDGTVWTTGSNKYGQLGDGSMSMRNAMHLVPAGEMQSGSLGTAEGIAAGFLHSMVLREDGSVWVAGSNHFGQLGDGSPKKDDRTTFVSAISNGGRAVAAGYFHSMILKRDGSFWVSGACTEGQLGDGSTIDKNVFVKVAGAMDQGFDRISLGSSHSLIVKSDDSVWAVGGNHFGQVGAGLKTNPVTSFVEVMPGAKAVAADGGGHSMVLKQDGSVWATGRNQNGQLGDGSDTDSDSFVRAISGDVKVMAAGSKHSLVIKDDGSVWAVGSNADGQLGDSSVSTTKEYLKVEFLSQVVRAQAVSAGVEHSMVLGQDGSVWTSGGNEFGQLGDGTTIKKGRFVQVISAGAKAIAAGGYHSMMLKEDGSVWATGSNEYGQLGDGSKKSTASMIRITNDFMQSFGRNIKAIAAGFLHSMVLEEDGTVWATGRNDYGQLGDGSQITKKLFVRVNGGVQGMAAGGFHSMILKRDGSFWATGANNEGQLGDGTTIDRTRYVKVEHSQSGFEPPSEEPSAVHYDHGDRPDVALAVRPGSKRPSPVIFAPNTDPICPKCGTMKISGRLSCCARGGAWFHKCGDTNSNFEHTWTDGTRACRSSVSSIVATAATTPITTDEAPSGVTSVSEMNSQRCPKCGTISRSGRLSCCARGGAWFQKCGDAGDSNFDHTWIEGIRACKSSRDAPSPAAMTTAGTTATTTLIATDAPTTSDMLTRSSKMCPKCGKGKKSGKLSCCARGGTWFQKCGDAGDSEADHTWVEGIQACNIESMLPIPTHVQVMLRYESVTTQTTNSSWIENVVDQQVNKHPGGTTSHVGSTNSKYGAKLADIVVVASIMSIMVCCK